ncbi:MAG: S1-like domain-containing RNA-binding protein [Muribaculaceae bacterium]
MVEIGKLNKLPIVKFVDFGLYLDAGNGEEILLPIRYVTDDMNVGDEIDVFIYADSEDRLVATTENPKAKVGEFAFLQVVAVNAVGAFLDWGLLKDVLVPFREQKVRMEKGRYYVVYIYLDDNTKRIVASAKLDKFLDNVVPKYNVGDEVEILVTKRTDLGFKVVVDNMFGGMIYHNEIFKDINIGERQQAYIKSVRDDGKIDITLGNKGGVRVSSLAEEIIIYLQEHDGVMTLTDSSTPDEIRSTFQCSKKDFKKALGTLFKCGEILITSAEITLKEFRR